VRLCALIDKHERRQGNITVDYVGRIVEKGFLVGYGLDYAERYRHLPAIYDLQI
jgi:hypoxanthine phosphoribosyltransferase